MGSPSPTSLGDIGIFATPCYRLLSKRQLRAFTQSWPQLKAVASQVRQLSAPPCVVYAIGNSPYPRARLAPAGQAEALRHGVATALQGLNFGLRPLLKEEGFLTRDRRQRERKKPGQAGARKKFAWVKR